MHVRNYSSKLMLAQKCAVNETLLVWEFQCFIRDGSRSAAVAVQAEAANHRPVLF